MEFYQAFWAIVIAFSVGQITGYYMGLYKGKHEELLNRINEDLYKSKVTMDFKNNATPEQIKAALEGLNIDAKNYSTT